MGLTQYVASTAARLMLHFLPGYAPELNPDELVWSHTKRTGVARRPLRKGEKLESNESMNSCGRSPMTLSSCAHSSGTRLSPMFLIAA